MKNINFKIICIALLVSTLSSCSWFRGDGDVDEEGTIPVATLGSELKDVNFGFDSADLDSAAVSTLKKNSQYLIDNSSLKVNVEGHTDNRGTNEYNLALGERRANAALNYLKTSGVNGSRLSAVSYGEELPLDPSDSEDAYSKNRRAHFSVQK